MALGGAVFPWKIFLFLLVTTVLNLAAVGMGGGTPIDPTALIPVMPSSILDITGWLGFAGAMLGLVGTLIGFTIPLPVPLNFLWGLLNLMGWSIIALSLASIIRGIIS